MTTATAHTLTAPAEAPSKGVGCGELVRRLGPQARGTPEELALMATLHPCRCGNDVLQMLEPCRIVCNDDECGEYWDGLNWEEAIAAWNSQTPPGPTPQVLGGFL